MYERNKILELFEEQKDFYNQKVENGIERYRKGDATIIVTDKNGNPVLNAKISAKQTTHEFKFGANLFMLDELETEEKNQTYKKYFADVFNMATLPFYWSTLEPERNKTRYDKDSPKIYRRPAPDLCLEFCEKHGIEPREHGLAYELFFPDWLYNASVEEIKTELERRYKEIAFRYADKIPTIEVTNEMEHLQGKTAFYDQADYVEWCFKLAEKYFKNNQLVINEHTSACWVDKCRATDKYYSYIQANILKGARIDAIGMQYHIFRKKEEEYEYSKFVLNPQLLYKHLDLYSDFGKPLQITEITIPAYSWKPEDEELQAQTIEKLYSLWFSHPNVEQIIYWNLVDGYAHLWHNDLEKIKASQGDMTIGENYYYGGLLRFDLSPKPAYYKIKELTQQKWRTNVNLETNQNGTTSFRGFYGNYKLEITIDGKTTTKQITLSKKGQNNFNITL